MLPVLSSELAAPVLIVIVPDDPSADEPVARRNEPDAPSDVEESPVITSTSPVPLDTLCADATRTLPDWPVADAPDAMLTAPPLPEPATPTVTLTEPLALLLLSPVVMVTLPDASSLALPVEMATPPSVAARPSPSTLDTPTRPPSTLIVPADDTRIAPVSPLLARPLAMSISPEEPSDAEPVRKLKDPLAPCAEPDVNATAPEDAVEDAALAEASVTMPLPSAPDPLMITVAPPDPASLSPERRFTLPPLVAEIRTEPIEPSLSSDAETPAVTMTSP
jgi:hypothetical protein